MRDWAKLQVDRLMSKDRKHSRFCFFFFLPQNRIASSVFFINGKDWDFRHIQPEAAGKAAMDHQPNWRHKWFHILSFTQSNRFLSQPLLYTWCSTLARKTTLLNEMEETSIKHRLSLSSGNETLQPSRQYLCLKTRMRKDEMQNK